MSVLPGQDPETVMATLITPLTSLKWKINTDNIVTIKLTALCTETNELNVELQNTDSKNRNSALSQLMSKYPSGDLPFATFKKYKIHPTDIFKNDELKPTMFLEVGEDNSWTVAIAFPCRDITKENMHVNACVRSSTY